jgi:hypothetical protein
MDDALEPIVQIEQEVDSVPSEKGTISWEEFEAQMMADPKFLAAIKNSRENPGSHVTHDLSSYPRE